MYIPTSSLHLKVSTLEVFTWCSIGASPVCSSKTEVT